jgi:hypothetical protein
MKSLEPPPNIDSSADTPPTWDPTDPVTSLEALHDYVERRRLCHNCYRRAIDVHRCGTRRFG